MKNIQWMNKKGRYKIMSGFVRYGDLQKNDVVWFHGAQVLIKDVRVVGICDNEFCKGERIINFDIEPYNDEALQILGKFYGYGTYGGVESLALWKD